MDDTVEQAQLRAHVNELRRAAREIRHDLVLDLGDVERKIDRLGHATRKDAKYLILDIEDDLANGSRAVRRELERLPGTIRADAIATAGAIQDGVVGAVTATREAVVDAAEATREHSKNAFARLAGVNRKPMREWKDPP
ncbi:MAG: hypothetical protein ACRECR_03895 [Thermoplasmata archaeon]